MKVNTFTLNNYDGGLNDTASASEIARNEASLLRNWDITYSGELKRRDGLVAVGSFDGAIEDTFDSLNVAESVTVSIA